MIETFSKNERPRAYPFLHPNQTGLGAKKYLAYDPIEVSISDDGKKWVSCFDVLDLQNIYCYSAPGVQPAVPTNELKKIGLQDGSRLLSSTYANRDITVKFISYGNLNESDVMLGYDALQSFFVSRDAYWICFSTWPQRMYYVTAKLGTPEFSSLTGWSVDVTFTDLIGLSRSVGTTADFDKKDMVEGFGNNQSIDRPKYTFTTNKFTVVNTSAVLIDPERRGHPFVLTLDGESEGKMKITNKTTNESITRTGVSSTTKDGTKQDAKSDFKGKWVLDGIRKTLNGKSDNLQCDTGVLTLQKGKNEFEVENFKGTITFDFALWWLS